MSYVYAGLAVAWLLGAFSLAGYLDERFKAAPAFLAAPIAVLWLMLTAVGAGAFGVLALVGLLG